MGEKKLASAIRYLPEDPAPALLASGRGMTAERIVSFAEQAGVTVIEDTALAVLLDLWAGSPGVKPGDFIPEWCWEAAAKILAFVIGEEHGR